MMTIPHTRQNLPVPLRTALRVFYQALLLTCVLTLLGFLGKYSWVIDLTSHFRMQYFLFLMAGVGVLALARAQYRWMAPVVLCAGLNLGFLLPYVSAWPEQVTQAAAPQTTLRVLHINVLKYGSDYDGVAQSIRNADPDILSLQELNPKWRQALEERGVLGKFAYRNTQARAEIGLYTDLPVRDSEIITAGPGQLAAIHARVSWNGRPVSVLVMHPPAPVNADYAAGQRRLFALVAQAYQAGDIEPDSILVGDLNTTPFSWPYRRFVDDTGLKDFRRDFGYLPSWPSVVPPLWIPIDHVLVSGDWRVEQAKVGPTLGSDHLPVRVDLRLKG